MKALSLFSGIGGIDLAAEWAGIETIAFCEIEPFPQKVLKKYWPQVPIYPDVKKLSKQILLDDGVIEDGTVDIIFGGFPCQPFSVAGKRKGKEDDRDLWPEMFRIIQEIKPTWIVGENVANFANMELERTLIDLESEGYETQTFIIPAAGVNAKHQRYRTFIIAYSDSSRFLEREKQQETIQQPKQQKLQREESKQSFLSEFICSSDTVMADTNNQGLQGGKETGNIESQREKADELFTGFYTSRAKWEFEPNVGRVANGIPNRVDRLKGLGNAVVPQQIYPILKAIVDIEEGRL